MNKLMTLDLSIKKQLRIDQLLRVSQLAKSYDGKIYFLLRNKTIIDAAKLPSLVTCFLTVKDGQTLKILIDGPAPQQIINDLIEICSRTITLQQQHLLQPAMKVKL
ncbi:hypothetical protein WQ54_18605 [Bacillus sp. SA1-12]|uniref:hypothetical protein n=1 Tax=Bacillus sp. SA1-12 TaxID=1455638 RepID=UPI00062732D1|nr:hypothetical protein [Bacillus sp. SA1-12]KKI90763.1 hypothetical protein WQ54_18605 [Bacillus sp. SA1-12]